jgi:hypothetical protein
VNEFIAGASTLACLAIALFFFRFWRSSGDRLFAIFGLAFAVFAANRLVLTVLDETDEGRTYVYLVRLAAFLLIMAAILDKNRGSRADA